MSDSKEGDPMGMFATRHFVKSTNDDCNVKV